MSSLACHESPSPTNTANTAISPLMEMGAYEALWDQEGATFKRLSERFGSKPGALPSHFVKTSDAERYARCAIKRLREANVEDFGIRIHGAGEYPQGLRDAQYPVELIYYQGWWDLVNSRCVAVVGARKPSTAGLKRTRQLVKALVEDEFTVVSGMAAGIDRAAHTAAIEYGGRTIAVLGTPINKIYPYENRDLQEELAKQFLIISQVPIVRYGRQDHRVNRGFFPERNKTMSALTEATVIVEAAETSGTLIQAKAALQQKRKLFILDSCFQSGLKWPSEFEKRGAIRVKAYDDIKRSLSATSHGDRRPHEGGSLLSH